MSPRNKTEGLSEALAVIDINTNNIIKIILNIFIIYTILIYIKNKYINKPV